MASYSVLKHMKARRELQFLEIKSQAYEIFAMTHSRHFQKFSTLSAGLVGVSNSEIESDVFFLNISHGLIELIELYEIACVTNSLKLSLSDDASKKNSSFFFSLKNKELVTHVTSSYSTILTFPFVRLFSAMFFNSIFSSQINFSLR